MLAVLISLAAPALGAVRAQRKMLELEKNAGINEPPVPRDRLLRSRFKFPAPAFEEAARAFEIGHAVSEVVYDGAGYWDCPGEYSSTLRYTSNRVLGYISGYRALGQEVYKQRALEGLDYLLRAQSDDGDFPWYYNSYGGVYNRDDGLFEAGIAGRAFVEGYKLTNDERWLEASAKVARWEMDCPISANNNYNMFAVWHLAAHYELTQDAAQLESAVEKTRLGGMPNQLPSGGWPGHNSWMWYHGIITRGMAELYRVLEGKHPFKAELKPSLIAAINRAIREQTASGETPPNPRVKRRAHTCPFILNALLIARGSFGAALDNCIYGILRYRLRRTPDEAFVRELAAAWKLYNYQRRTAREDATGEIAWQAQFGRFVKDVEWGEVAPGAFNCWYPCNDFDPKHQRWRRARSRRTGEDAQEIVSRGARLFGGMGWSIPKKVLTPGRRCLFTASVRCTGGPAKIPLIMCSAYSGKKRPTWDPFTDCSFTRENPTFDSYSQISVPFVASANANYVYVWAMGADLGESDSVSIVVDDARITDAGRPLPQWDSRLDDFDSQTDMLLLPTALYLESIR